MIELFVRAARLHRSRYILTFLAIVLSTAFTVVSLELGRYGRDAATASSGSGYGQATAVVTPKAPSANRNLAAEVARVPTVGEAYGQSSHEARIRYEAKAVDFRAFNVPDPAFGFYKLLDGRMPLQTNEIAVTQALASSLGLKIGDTVTVGIKYRSKDQPEEQSFSAPPMVVSGIYESSGSTLATGTSLTGYVADATSRQWLVREGKNPNEAVDKVYVTAAAGASDAQMLSEVSRLPGVVVQSRSSMAQDRAKRLLDSASIMETTTLALGLFAVALTCVVIWNTFQVLALTRRRSLATLRCLGASVRQIWAMVLGEALLLGTVSATLGLGIGMALAEFIPKVVRGPEEAWEIPSSITLHPPFALLALATGVLITLGCAIWPGYRATHTAPLAALDEGEPAGDPRAPGLRRRLLPGAVVMGLGVCVVVLGQSVSALRLGTEPGIWGIGVGGTLLIASSVLLSPFLSGATAAPVARAVRALAPQDRRVDAEFAAENIKRSPRRSGAAISALFITTWLLTGAAAGASSARETLLANLDAGHSHDINVYQAFDSEGLGMGISPEQQASVAAARGVSGVLPIYETKVKTSVAGYESTTVEAFDPSVARTVVSARSGPAKLHEGRLLLPENGGRTVGSASAVGNNGRSIRLEVRYGKVAKPTMALADLKRISSTGPPTTLWASVADSAGSSTQIATGVATGVNAVSGAHPPVVTSWMLRQHRAYRTAVARVTGVFSAHLVVATLIAAAGVTSPIALALVERRRETAVLRSLGQTRHSLRNALTIEQAALGSVGMALGLVFGVVGSVLTTRALFSGVDTGIFISVPWLSISIVIGLEFLVTVGLTAVPAKSWMERRSTSFRDGNFLRL